MNNTLNQHPLQPDLEKLAQRRARAKMGWYTHASVYVLVNLFLVALSVSSGRYWAVYPALGWGLGLALQGMSVFVWGAGSSLRERMVQTERERLAQRGHGG